MKKLILLTLLSSLCYARDIENCDGFNLEINKFSELTFEFSLSVAKLDPKNLNQDIITECRDKNKEIEELADHMVYYHQKDLDTVQLNSMRKFKVNSFKVNSVLDNLTKSMKEGKYER